MSTTAIARSSRYTSSTITIPFRPCQRRLLSSSATCRAVKPESPKYIEVPEAIQPPKTPAPALKGVLPVRRNILTRKTQYKATPQWLDRSAPQPMVEEETDASKLERAAYKGRLAKMRRSNIRQGMSELHARYVSNQDAEEAKKEHDILLKLKAGNTPERHDEKWTRPTVSKAVRTILERKDNFRKESFKSMSARRSRYLKQEEARKAERSESLHALYLNARTFILTEEKLGEEIESIFGADDNPATWAGSHRSVWSLGLPPGTEKLAGQMPDMSTDLSRGKNYEQMSDIMRKRMMQIAGKLTGGEIDIPDNLAKRAAAGKHDLF